MIKHIVKRVLVSIPVIFGVILILFIMLRVVPGNPITTMMGEHVNETVIEKVSEEMGLNQPLPVQFFKYIGNMLKGDLGTSYKMNRNVTSMILDAFKTTLLLAVVAAVFAWIVGMIAGIGASVSSHKIIDRVFMSSALIGISMPVFMISLLLQYIFAYKLHWFSISQDTGFKRMLLPAIALGWGCAGSIARLVRSSLNEAMKGEYIDTARAKGVGKIRILVMHALKNAMLPVITMMAIQLSSLMSGAVITESVFGLPGIGRLAVDAISSRDMPLLQGTVIFTTIIVILGNLIADMMYSVVDPRIRRR